ncbi:MAG: protein phosphatase 2C domain-containing protein [Pseudomonadota bacterium]
MSQSASDAIDWLDIHGDQIIGQRSSQQDGFASAWLPGVDDAKTARLLLLLADGMGGHHAGDVASAQAIKAFMLSAQEHAENDSVSILFCGLQAAGSAVFERAAADASLRDMGTTLIALIIEKSKGQIVYHMISVGDSPIWHWSKAQRNLIRANEDQSLFGELMQDVNDGKLTQGQAEVDPRWNMGNVLTSAIVANSENDYKIDSTQRSGPRKLEKGDLLILSSDGLDTLTRPELSEQLSQACDEGFGAERVTHGLLDAVSKKHDPQQDNTTVLTVRIAPPAIVRRRKILGIF